MNRTTLFGESKCFLAKRDNFLPDEQTLRMSLVKKQVRHVYSSFKIEFTSPQSYTKSLVSLAGAI